MMTIGKRTAIILEEIIEEVNRGNEKHSSGPMANPLQMVAILTEEVGEFAQAILKNQSLSARAELIQVAAVALNYLCGTGPHYSSK